MVSVSVGRRLILIVMIFTGLLVTAVLFIAIQTTTSVLRSVNEQNFRDQHSTLTNAITQRIEGIESQTDELTAIIAARSQWTPVEMRAFIIDIIGSSAFNPEIITANVYRPTLQSQIFTFDYQRPPDLPQGMIMPTNRGTSIERLNDSAWIIAASGSDRAGWYGPYQSLFGWYEGDVMAYAVPLSDPVGLVWVEVPLVILNETVENLLEIENTEAAGQDAPTPYYFLVTDSADQIVIAAVNTPYERTIPGQSLIALDELPPRNEPIIMNDLLFPNGRAYTLTGAIPGTGWNLVSGLPTNALPQALPLNALGRLIVVTVSGFFILLFIMQRYISSAITGPLYRLSLSAQEIGDGKLQREIDHQDRQDEIGRLARALEEMKTNLASSYAELENWGNTLEQRVRSRTRQADIARREAQASANELRAVYDESLMVVSAYELPTILQTLTRRLTALLEASYIGVWLLTEDEKHLELVANSMTDKRLIGTQIPIGTGLVGRAVQNNELLVVDDYPNWANKLPVQTSDMVHQAMAVPLFFSGQPIGAVIAGRSFDAPFFEAEDQRLFRLFANLVSPAIRNAQLFNQLNEAVHEARRANTVKTRFLASVTHELRTPLNLVINNMDFMRIGAFGEINTEQGERLDQTIRSAEHLLHLINDLLDVSKIEAGEMQMFLQENDLYTILDDVLANTEVVLEQHNKHEKVTFVTEIDDEIPTFPFDARRIRQVMVNLLSNAVKFTETGQVTLRVQNRKHYLRVDVSDTGMGIPEGEIDKLFEAFERTRSAKEKAIEGTGLGLPISKFLVEAHGGEMTVQSVVNEGTTFTFTLPIKPQRRQTDTDTQQMSALLNRIRTEDNSNSETA